MKAPPPDDLAAELAAHPGYLIRRAHQVSVALFSEAFGRYVAQIWSDLREEASRGMNDDESRALHAHEHK